MENHLSGFAKFALMRRDDPRQGRRQLRPQRDFAVAFVGEIEKLRDDFGAALFFVKLGRLEDRAVPFDKAVAAADFAPAREDVHSERRSRPAKNLESREVVAWQ